MADAGRRIPETRRYEKSSRGTGQQAAAKAEPLPPWKRLSPLDGLLGIVLLALLGTFIVPVVQEGTRDANAQAALALLRDIARMQGEFQKKNPEGRFAASLFDLAAAGIYQGEAPEAGTVSRGGYVFAVQTLSDGAAFFATAVPVRFGDTGSVAYYVDDSGKIRVSRGPVVGPAFPEVP